MTPKLGINPSPGDVVFFPNTVEDAFGAKITRSSSRICACRCEPFVHSIDANFSFVIFLLALRPVCRILRLLFFVSLDCSFDCTCI